MMRYNFIKDGVAYECDIDALLPHPVTEAPTLTSSYLQLTASEVASIRLDKVRELRDDLIAATDWWAGSDRTMTDAQTAYRQALRDITASATSLDDVTWPTKP